jgi:outer membrane lipoprotein-sorting protein
VTERRSDYLYSRFDRVRIENAAPLEHTVIWNGETLWIWSPRENAAVEQPAKDVSTLSRTLLSVQPGFGIDLLAPIPLDAYRAEAAAAASGEAGEVVVTLTPVDKAVPRATMQLVVDTARKHVTRMLVLTERGSVLSDLRLTKPIEAKPGIWFATQIEVRQLLEDGSTLEELRTWERLAFDVTVDPTRFEFKVPDGATRVPVESLAPAAGRGDVQ